MNAPLYAAAILIGGSTGWVAGRVFRRQFRAMHHLDQDDAGGAPDLFDHPALSAGAEWPPQPSLPDGEWWMQLTGPDLHTVLTNNEPGGEATCPCPRQFTVSVDTAHAVIAPCCHTVVIVGDVPTAGLLWLAERLDELVEGRA